MTGRAGTGKSTLLRGIVRALDSQLVIVAPTGIAALNVGGETLHSLFRLPQGLLLDGDEERSSPRNIFEVDDLILVIDEVSMVRSDVLNAIDLAFRQQRQSQAPFGGVRVIAFGDTHQLPPVVDRYEDERLKDAFGGAFFFHAPPASSMSMVELTEVFRQKDERFVALLLGGEHVAGRADALAVEQDRVTVVLDWKSDVGPTAQDRAQHAAQLADYRDIVGAERGAVVYMSMGEMAWL